MNWRNLLIQKIGLYPLLCIKLSPPSTKKKTNNNTKTTHSILFYEYKKRCNILITFNKIY